MKIKNKQPIFLYNLTKRMWLSDPVLRHLPQHPPTELYPTPLIQTQQQNAIAYEFNLISPTQFYLKSLKQFKRMIIGSPTKRVDSFHGNLVTLINPKTDQSFFYKWTILHSSKTIMFGTPYLITNNINGGYLNGRYLKEWKNQTQLVVQNMYGDKWVFIPATQLYTCDNTKCVKNKIQDNTDMEFQCSNNQCFNKYGDIVTNTMFKCERKCFKKIQDNPNNILTKSQLKNLDTYGMDPKVYTNTLFHTFILILYYIFLMLLFFIIIICILKK
jgi:hypothetical protein